MRRPLLGLSVVAAALAAVSPPAAAVEIHPYGFLLAGYVENWGRANSAEVPTQAASAGTSAASNQNTSVLTARQSRLGLAVKGGKGPWDSDLAGALEMDFYGLRNTGTAGLDAMASAPRLRLAYLQANKGAETVVFGQDFTKAFSPLAPTSLMHVGTPALSNSGNLWNRLPQLRWDRTWGLPAGWAVNTKVALVRSFTADETGRTATAGGTTFAVSNSVDAAGSGEFSGGPAYQALAQIQKTVDGRAFLAGVAGQYLRESFNAAEPPPAGAANNRVSGWLWSAHFDLPVHPRLELTGAAFYGRGDQNQNGLGAVYNDQGTIRQSLARGGWAQAAFRLAPDWRVDAMGGFESVDQLGLAAGTVYRNESAAVNVLWDASRELTLALEAGRIHSYYVAALAGDSENLGLTAQYKF